MLEEIKLLLGDSAANYTDALIELRYRMALSDVEAYCGRDADEVMQLAAVKIAVIMLNRMGTEGLASQSFSGVSESYMSELPPDIMAVLKRKRKVKVI